MTTNLTRAQLAEQVALHEAIAAQSTSMAQQYRRALTVQAEREFREHGAAPTWRMGDFATISSHTAQPRFTVADRDAFTVWVLEQHPDEVRPVVNAAWEKALLRRVRATEDGKAVQADGQLVPGVTFQPGGQFKNLTFLFSEETKRTFAEVAEMAIARLQLEPERAVIDQAPELPVAPISGPASDSAVDEFLSKASPASAVDAFLAA